MSRLSPLHRHALRLAGTAGVLLVVAACGGSSGGTTVSPAAGGTAKAAAVHAASTDEGTILVDGRGRAMYAFAADKKGTSKCTGTCLTYWPPVEVGASPPTQASGVTATFGVLHRSDGTSQLTADGWPMYNYVGDGAPGDTSGQGKNLYGGHWWVLDSAGKWITTADGSSSPPARGGY